MHVGLYQIYVFKTDLARHFLSLELLLPIDNETDPDPFRATSKQPYHLVLEPPMPFMLLPSVLVLVLAFGLGNGGGIPGLGPSSGRSVSYLQAHGNSPSESNAQQQSVRSAQALHRRAPVIGPESVHSLSPFQPNEVALQVREKVDRKDPYLYWLTDAQTRLARSVRKRYPERFTDAAATRAFAEVERNNKILDRAAARPELKYAVRSHFRQRYRQSGYPDDAEVVNPHHLHQLTEAEHRLHAIPDPHAEQLEPLRMPTPAGGKKGRSERKRWKKGV